MFKLLGEFVGSHEFMAIVAFTAAINFVVAMLVALN